MINVDKLLNVYLSTYGAKSIKIDNNNIIYKKEDDKFVIPILDMVNAFTGKHLGIQEVKDV